MEVMGRQDDIGGNNSRCFETFGGFCFGMDTNRVLNTLFQYVCMDLTVCLLMYQRLKCKVHSFSLLHSEGAEKESTI